ncbi:energy-coupling factor transporter transmembrane component T family protein [Listeria fleischmannii]|jgi:energy-coupling factor transport system permease protein|uniref:Energy-coupling factor transporter transmembrane protein EcfT n=1 Tax=Listeria fleischmannii TaxID=1069827 RepID=A0A841YCI4_9LIST|nr:energy-coupling factor transporter transmembrane protein EcfT [Listeria fleischmannii]EIA21511.1 cobalt ABC transporter, permease protein [Listeria fleischmannii subsp. coloradonensis]MBC1397908.1 energy-coupling factor transporter transmembrane protein EcfT [Listeria fleischmannii]MBC1425969.1 energy-coupling factor transporter transmembrane protein EcfT [Listeria fleischmannii]STY34240.1 Energy-coupling factor transporter transmembrane protein EcfT [Listeria fleischmannii subsp. coloradone
MMDKMILGRYIPGDSWLHKIDPRAKITAVMAFIVIVFLANNWMTYAILFVYVLYLVLTSKVPFLFFLKGLQPIMWLILLTLLLQVFFTQGGEVLFSFGPIKITMLGLMNGVKMFCRFVLIVFMTTLLTLTTSPIELTDGLEKILAPFRIVRLPVHELALMLSISLRFIPTLMDETEKIMKAQKARGVEFTSGKISDRIRAIVPLLIPLFISAFKRAEDLAIAMEARGYRGGHGRTKFRLLKWRFSDTILLFSLVVLTGLLLLLRN